MTVSSAEADKRPIAGPYSQVPWCPDCGLMMDRIALAVVARVLFRCWRCALLWSEEKGFHG